MNIKEQKYEQFLQEIAEKEHRSMEEVKRFKDIRIGFDNGWDAALLSQWRDASKELPTDSIGKEYLIHVEYNDGSGFNHCSAAFINGHWNILDDEILEDVDSGKCEITHYMEIPQLSNQ